jgi:hypothetical protein
MKSDPGAVPGLRRELRADPAKTVDGCKSSFQLFGKPV